MATYYYNPKVYTPKTALQDVRRVEPRWAALYEKDPERICESREAALQHTFEGPILFRENGVLMEALLVPDWCYSPIDDNRVWTQSGINWYTDYATDKKTLADHYFATHKHSQIPYDREDVLNAITYDEKLGVYSLHIHYSDGRIG